jgi:hypothetical protein
MEPFDLPTAAPHPRAVLTGVEWHTLPHTATLGHHGVNVHGTESRNKSMAVLIENPYEGLKTVAKRRVGEWVFVGGP